MKKGPDGAFFCASLVRYSRIVKDACHKAIPAQTLTLMLCFTPNCGISRMASDASNTSGWTPLTSLPNTSAHRSVAAGRHASNAMLVGACSTDATFHP